MILFEKIHEFDHLAGASHRGEFEERLKSVLKEIESSNGGIILFIDEIHLVLGAGKAEGAMDAANLLKPMLGKRCDFQSNMYLLLIF